MKIAFLTFDFGEYCVRIASALAERAQTRLWIPEREFAAHNTMASPALEVSAFTKPRLRDVRRQTALMRKLVREIRAFDPDVIHLQSGHLWFNCALWLLRSYPLVVTVHDVIRHPGDRGAQNTPQFVSDLAYRAAKQIIVHAPQLRQTLLDRLRIAPERVHVIPHVMCGEDNARPEVRETGNDILFFGRIWKYKGLEYLIRAEPLITSQVPAARFVIAGTGEDMDTYRRMMVHPDRFEIHNEYVSDQRRAELFRRASVVVLPYTEASQSGVIPVAYQCAKPVVCTSVGGLPAAVDDGETGFIVPPRDERALAERVVTLLQDGELRIRMGANGKRKLEAECSPQLVADKTLTVYQEATEWQQTGCTEL